MSQELNMKLRIASPVNEWVSIVKGALVAGCGVALTYLVQHVSASDFGVYGPLVVGVLSIVVNVLRKSIGIDTSDNR
jgi:hypothetical protein